MLLAAGLALLGAPHLVGPAGCESCGVLSCAYSRRPNATRTHRESVRSMRMLHVAMDKSAVYPTLLLANEHATEAFHGLGALHLWDAHRELVVSPAALVLLEARNQSVHSANPWLWKLSALMSSPFGRTLYLDADVCVLWPALVSTMLRSSLDIGDVAWPMDVGRYITAFRVVAPAPIHRACMFAYRDTAEVRGWFVGAAARLVNGSGAPAPRGVRQSGQEMLYYEWISSRHSLRMVTLPEEYYCPKAAYDDHNSTSPVWRTSCKAVHSHHVSDSTVARTLRGTRWSLDSPPPPGAAAAPAEPAAAPVPAGPLTPCSCFSTCNGSDTREFLESIPRVVDDPSSPWVGYLRTVYGGIAPPLPFNLSRLHFFYHRGAR